MMPKRRTRTDSSTHSRGRRGGAEALARRKHKGMTKEEFRRKLMEDLGYGQIYD